MESNQLYAILWPVLIIFVCMWVRHGRKLMKWRRERAVAEDHYRRHLPDAYSKWVQDGRPGNVEDYDRFVRTCLSCGSKNISQTYHWYRCMDCGDGDNIQVTDKTTAEEAVKND